jgi:beta-N-acetylhexosaminidase
MTPVDSLGSLAATTLMVSFTGPDVPGWLRQRVEDGLGSVCLFGSNLAAGDAPGDAVEAAARVSAELHAARPSVLVALDEEGGAVTRLEMRHGSSVPGNAALGAVDDVALTREVAGALGRLLASSGVDLDLAPCADVNSDPRNPVIGVRSFGADPEAVGRHVAAFVAGLGDAGVAACAKHFPGHGATTVDSHLGLPEIDVSLDVLRRRELVPFTSAVGVGVAAVMLGHLRVTAVDDAPATVSARVVDLLRSELGFTGAVVTDALDMAGIGGPRSIPANVVRALAAGADLCCLGPDASEDLVDACVEAVLGAVRCGSLDEERLADAAGRVAAIPAPAIPAPAIPAPADAGPGGSAPASPARTDHRSSATADAGRRADRHHAGATSATTGDRDPALAALGRLGQVAAVRAIQLDGGLEAPGAAGATGAASMPPSPSGPSSGLAGTAQARPPAGVPLRRAHVVEVRREPLIAEGHVPWGVAAALCQHDPATTAGVVSHVAEVPEALDAASGRPLVVVVRDPQSRSGNPEALAILDALVAARPDAVVVDMGWPDPDLVLPPGTTRLRTFGSGRVSGEGAAAVLSAGPGTPAESPAGGPDGLDRPGRPDGRIDAPPLAPTGRNVRG